MGRSPVARVGVRVSGQQELHTADDGVLTGGGRATGHQHRVAAYEQGVRVVG